MKRLVSLLAVFTILLSCLPLDSFAADAAPDEGQTAPAAQTEKDSKPAPPSGLSKEELDKWWEDFWNSIIGKPDQGSKDPDPTDPTEKPEPPQETEEPDTDSTEPSIPLDPIEPEDPPTEPTNPPTEPTDPPTEPTDPPTEPTDPPAAPTDPPIIIPPEPPRPVPPPAVPVVPEETQAPEEEEPQPVETEVSEKTTPEPSAPEAMPEDSIQQEPSLSENGETMRIELTPSEEGLVLNAQVSMDDFHELCRTLAQCDAPEGLTIACGSMELRYSMEALEAILEQAEDAASVSFSVENQLPEKAGINALQAETMAENPQGQLYSVELNITTLEGRNREIHDFGKGNASVTVPAHLEDGYQMKAYRVETDGGLTELSAHWDPDTETVTFVTPSHSHYMIQPVRNLHYIAWILAGIMFLAAVEVMYRNRNGYIYNDDI